MALTTIDDRGLKTPIDLLDNEKIRFGTGNDLEISHNGSGSKIHNNTGRLDIEGDQISFWNHAGNETLVDFNADGAVELYYDGSKKLETISGGITVTGGINTSLASTFATSTFSGNVKHGDGIKALFGTGDDLEIYHDGSNGNYIKSAVDDRDLFLQSTRDVYITTGDGSTGIHTFLYAADNAGVELRYDNSKKFETDANGVTITGQCALTSHVAWPDHSSGYVGKAVFGNGDDLQIYHDGTGSYIDDTGTGSLIIQSNTVQINNAGGTEVQAKFIENGAVELYYDNVKKAQTYPNGLELMQNLYMQAGGQYLSDNVKIHIGNSNDLEIYHNGSHSIIHDNGAGDLKIIGDDVIIQANNDETIAKFIENGACELYYDNSKKLETTSTGLKSESSSDLNIHLLKTGVQDTLIQNTGQTEICAATGGASGQRIVFRIGANTGSMPEIARFTPDGLCFGSDTAAANALDDYEEGSWNASISGAEGGGPTSYSGSGSYIKIGRLVYATLAWSNVTFPGLGGQLQISAPFTAGSDAKNPRGGWCYFHPNSAWDDYTDMVGMGARISAGESSFKLDVFLKDNVPTSQSAGSGGRNGNISEASSIYLDFSITYITA